MIKKIILFRPLFYIRKYKEKLHKEKK